MRRPPPSAPETRPCAPPPLRVSRLVACLLLVAIAACAASAAPRGEIAASTEPWTLTAQPFRGLLPLGPEAAGALSQALARGDAGAVALRFAGIRADRTPGAFYEVYLDLPAGAPPPGPNSPHYAGNLSLYGVESQAGAATQDLAVAGAIRALRQRGLWDDHQLAVTLVPQGATEATVRIERVALIAG